LQSGLQSAIASSSAILEIMCAVSSHRAQRVAINGNTREMKYSNPRPLSAKIFSP